MAGRAVLIQATSSAIPAYIMQSNLLPGKVLDGINKVNKNSGDQLKIRGKCIGWVGGRLQALKMKGDWGFKQQKEGIQCF